MTESTQTGSADTGNLLLDLANAFVGIHKERYGRGPDKSRAHVSGDLVVVVLEGGFSRAEQTLSEHGREDVVNQGRRAMQSTIEDTGVAAVERLTGRQVRSFMSANDAANELQSEIFVLEPAAKEPAADHADLCERARTACEENAEVREDLRALRAEQAQARDALHRNRTQKDRPA
jgi:uncharacterized protein YbcI